MNDLRRRRALISPRDLRKSSQSRRAASTVKVAGEREPTETGYRAAGYTGKNFETFFEVMLSGTASAFLLHEKKDRSFWVISGQGFLTTEDSVNGQKTRRIFPGEHVSLDRGVTYRIATTATDQLEFFVSQSAKYEVSLQIIAPSDATRVATEAQLAEPSLDERLSQGTSAQPVSRRRGSKAAQQQKLRHRRSPQVEETFKVVPDGRQVVPGSGGHVGVNAQPGGGRFDDAGAG